MTEYTVPPETLEEAAAKVWNRVPRLDRSRARDAAEITAKVLCPAAFEAGRHAERERGRSVLLAEVDELEKTGTRDEVEILEQIIASFPPLSAGSVNRGNGNA